MTVCLTKIVSGGQTGADQGALEAAISLGIPHGGWCPLGRISETGRIPNRYQLTETSSRLYPVRTRWNVRDSDGTLVLCTDPPAGGTALTVDLAQQLGKPIFIANPAMIEDQPKVTQWLRDHGIAVLNVAGPRESESPGIHATVKSFLEATLRENVI